MSPVICVESLGKCYRVNHADERLPYQTLRDSLTGVVTAPIRRWRAGGHAHVVEQFWALKDVSFEVQSGEVVGIIGRNGAGKSTLLKILSRITKPTCGHVILRGRVGSLLEVGTGFHPELTGRENIYMNGSILGMTRQEIRRKFDEIVDFSGVEKFLDTPVKRYSSGMQVRLAFAVAAHLDPEVLVIDEVLAVGDAEFQKKCLGKMGEVSKSGRTILFVSHNMAAVKSLCGRAALLDAGRVASEGPVDAVVDQYIQSGSELLNGSDIPDDVPRLGIGTIRFRSVQLNNCMGVELYEFYFGQPFRISFVCQVFRQVADAFFEIGLATLDGTRVTFASTLDGGRSPILLQPGTYLMEVEIDVVLLPGRYTVLLGVHHAVSGSTIDWLERTRDFGVTMVAEDPNESFRWGSNRGYVRPPSRWCLEQTEKLSPANPPQILQRNVAR